MINLEKRYLTTELRANKESRIIEGTAIVFNSDSRILAERGKVFIESIEPQAVKYETIINSDIKLLFNHNKDAGVVARSKNGKGSLEIYIDDVGVHFRTIAPHTRLGDDLITSIERGDLDGCSFEFSVNDDLDCEYSNTNIKGVKKRTVKNIRNLSDFSIVVEPAYPATTVNARALEKINEDEIKEKDEKFNEYYKKLLKKYL